MNDNEKGRKDHELTVFLNGGGTRTTSYRRLIETLGLTDEFIDGSQMSAGTEFQAHHVANLLAVEFREIKMVRVKEICYAC